ncbi:MAG: hypothetical protein JEZ07_03725 [Phycisphaerae bacterium]|nr:hypothetical protein [Phycisphaerae bacterium]
MNISDIDRSSIEKLKKLAQEKGLDITGGKIRRSSSRFCLGVEHGDYNGTELFGVGTDRFIWMAYKPNGTDRVRIYSDNFPNDGIIDFQLGNVPAPLAPETANSWARFPYGVDYILNKNGFKLNKGFDAVVYGNIPGGGMSRSASLALNLIITMMEINELKVEKDFDNVLLAQQVENEYIGSPCGLLDQIMIYYAKEGMGTHFDPKTNSIKYVPLGDGATDFRIVVMDTGTVRPGLEKSTYKIRREECDSFAEALAKEYGNLKCLGDVRDCNTFNAVKTKFADKPNWIERFDYIYHAQKRFYQMLDAWKAGDIETVGEIFRKDGIGLRDDYKISGAELETMCDIVRTVEGVMGERMLGGGDKGAAGCLVKAEAVDAVRKAVETCYPRSRPAFADKYAVHVCKVVDGITTLELE